LLLDIHLNEVDMTILVQIHVLISLLGIASGFVVLFGLVEGKRMDRLTAFFLTTTVLTSASGYLLPAHKLMPSHIVGAISLVVLAIAIFARYRRQLQGGWRSTYVVTATTAQYLNVFVLVVQSFMKVPALKALAPTQSEPPFAITQLLVLALFVVIGVVAVKGFGKQLTPLAAAVSR
jgi:hypothetical protein